VFAVPGSPLDPRAEGTNDLIRSGAHLCAGVEDVVRELAPIVTSPDLFGDALAGMAAGPTPTYRHEPLWDELLGDEAGFGEPSALPELADWPMAEELGPPAGDGRARLLSVLGPVPLDVDEVMRLSGLSLTEVQGHMLDLELDGRIERHGGNRVSLVA